jgi:hypothetical protein
MRNAPLYCRIQWSASRLRRYRLTAIGRGFDVAVAAPFGRPISEALRKVALRCAEACPSGALAVRGDRACDLGSGDGARRLVHVGDASPT